MKFFNFPHIYIFFFLTFVIEIPFSLNLSLSVEKMLNSSFNLLTKKDKNQYKENINLFFFDLLEENSIFNQTYKNLKKNNFISFILHFIA